MEEYFVYCGRREKTSETFGENQFGLLVVPNQDRTKYKFAYGNLGNNIPRIDADVEFNEWTHIAIVRSGNLETFYIDGCPQNTRSNSVSYDNTNLYIGSQSIKEFNLPLPFKGNLQDFRFSNKVVYEGCFSPPKEFKTKCPECFKCNVYTSNGEDQTLVIPNDVNRIFVQMWGAGGSSGRYQANKDAGGAGGYAEGYIDVVPGQKLIIGVGETTNGTDINTWHIPGYSIGGTAGYGGVGDHKGAGAGGGMSGIFLNSISADNALIIAGGGGGAAGSGTAPNAGGGGGGGETGISGSRFENDLGGGTGGTQTASGTGCGKGSQFNGGNGDTLGQSSGGGGGARLVWWRGWMCIGWTRLKWWRWLRVFVGKCK